MDSIPDYTETELWAVRTTVNQRYGKEVDLQLADSELRLDPDSPTLTSCPTIFWSERGANFVILKVGDSRYRCQFFNSGCEQYGRGARPTTTSLSAPRCCCRSSPTMGATAA